MVSTSRAPSWCGWIRRRGWQWWWIGHLQRVSESSSDACMLNLGRTISILFTSADLSLFVAAHHFKPQCSGIGSIKLAFCMTYLVLCSLRKIMIWLFQSDGQWQWPWLASAENTCLGSATCCSTFCKIQTSDVCCAQCLYKYIHACYFVVRHRHSGQIVWSTSKTGQLQDLVFRKYQNCIVAQSALIAILVHRAHCTTERAKDLLRKVKTVSK